MRLFSSWKIVKDRRARYRVPRRCRNDEYEQQLPGVTVIAATRCCQIKESNRAVRTRRFYFRAGFSSEKL